MNTHYESPNASAVEYCGVSVICGSYYNESYENSMRRDEEFYSNWE